MAQTRRYLFRLAPVVLVRRVRQLRRLLLLCRSRRPGVGRNFRHWLVGQQLRRGRGHLVQLQLLLELLLLLLLLLQKLVVLIVPERSRQGAPLVRGAEEKIGLRTFVWNSYIKCWTYFELTKKVEDPPAGLTKRPPECWLEAVGSPAGWKEEEEETKLSS